MKSTGKSFQAIAAGAHVWLFLVLAVPVAAAPLAYILNDTPHRP